MKPERVDTDNWHDVIEFFMPRMALTAYYYAKNRGWHTDEAIAEAYYVLTVKVLWMIEHQPDIDDKTEAMLRSTVRRQLTSYFRYRKDVRIEDTLGENWQTVYGHLIATPAIEVSLESLMKDLTESPRELAVLILKVDNHSDQEVAGLLGLRVDHVSKIVNRVYGRIKLDYLHGD